MKSKIRTIAMLVLVAALASCQEISNPDGQESGNTTVESGKLCLTVSFAPPTRVNYGEVAGESGTTDLQPVFETGDQVILIEGTDTYGLIVSSVSSGTATLTGDAPDCADARLLYKKGATEESWNSSEGMEVSYSGQTGAADASVFISAPAEIKDGEGSFTLASAGAIIGITNARGVPAGAKIIGVTVEGANITSANVGTDFNCAAISSSLNESITTATLNGYEVASDGRIVNSSSQVNPIFISIPVGDETKVNKVTLSTDKGDWSIFGSAEVKSYDTYLYVKNNLFGALPGKFSVSPTKQVYFSQGNLQATYHESTRSYTWGFAANQYGVVGKAAGNTTIDNQSDGAVVDLFGWSTSATDYGISVSKENVDYSGDFVDWGNAIAPGVWRTLTGGKETPGEWAYLFGMKYNGSKLVDDPDNTVRYKLYAMGATVYGLSTKCTVLYPDGYTGTIADRNDTTSYDSEEEYLAATLEGIVFLPKAGVREGSSVTFNATSPAFTGGNYASSSPSGTTNAWYVNMDSVSILPGANNGRYRGYSVRLVMDCK